MRACASAEKRKNKTTFPAFSSDFSSSAPSHEGSVTGPTPGAHTGAGMSKSPGQVPAKDASPTSSVQSTDLKDRTGSMALMFRGGLKVHAFETGREGQEGVCDLRREGL